MPAILFVGVVYPAVILFGALVSCFNSIVTPAFYNFELVLWLILSLLALLLAFLAIGFSVALVFGALSILFVSFCNLTIRNYCDVTSVTGFAGGMTGFVPLVLPLLMLVPPPFQSLMIYVFIGPTSAMIAASACAIWYVERNFRIEIDDFFGQRHPTFQFNILHVLMLTGLVSLVIASSRMFNQVDFALVGAYWALTQSISVWFLKRLIRLPRVLPDGPKSELRRS